MKREKKNKINGKKKKRKKERNKRKALETGL